MADAMTLRRVLSPDYVGTLEVHATDRADNARVHLGLRGEVTSVIVLALNATTKSEDGLRESILEAANRAEAARVLNELALIDGIDPEAPVTHWVPPPLPGPKADPLVIRPPEEQANHLARYINNGGLDPVVAPGTRWEVSSNGYLRLGFNDRGQLAAIEPDQEWLHAVTLDRLNNAFKEAVTR